MYNDPDANNTFWTVYMVFGLGCIILFFFGVCALLCCCRSRFRGMERKGYVIRDAGPSQPLIQPGMAGGQSVVITGSFPALPSQYVSQVMPHNPSEVMQHNPPQAPPPYEMPAKY